MQNNISNPVSKTKEIFCYLVIWWKIQSIYVNTVAWVNKKKESVKTNKTAMYSDAKWFSSIWFSIRAKAVSIRDEVYQPTMFKNCTASSLTNRAYIMPLILTAIIISIWRPSKSLLFIFLLYIIPYPMQNGWFFVRASFPWHLSTSSAIITRLKVTHAQRIRNIVRVHVKKGKRLAHIVSFARGGIYNVEMRFFSFGGCKLSAWR